MTQDNGSRKSRRFGGTGLYIALFLCVAAVAVAGYWSLFPNKTENEIERLPEIETDDSVIAQAPEIDDIVGVPVHSAAEVSVPDPVITAPKTQDSETLGLVVAPLSGETVAAFSMDELAYSETLSDWRTHDGIDIAATVGTQVLAACSGTVSAVTDDDLMGTTVVLSHGEGYETTYANLQEVPTVAVGDYVSAGQVIGAVGETSIAESATAPHLHFSVSKGGDLLDPNEFLSRK